MSYTTPYTTPYSPVYNQEDEDPAAKQKPRQQTNNAAIIIGIIAALAFCFGLAGLIVALVHVGGNHVDYCSDCCHDVDTLVYFDFTSDSPSVLESACFDVDDADCAFTLFPFGEGVYASDASSIDVGGEDGLIVDSFPFTSTVPPEGNGPDPYGGLDHVKFLAYLGNGNNFRPFATHRKGDCDATELVYSANLTCTVDLNLENFPEAYTSGGVLFPQEDYRLAACGFNTIAFQEHNNGVGEGAWQVADFFFTNERVFIINERLPFGRPSSYGTLNEYASYTQVVPVARRTPDQYHKVAIAYNKARGTIRYILDDQEVYRVTRPGMRPDICDLALYHGGEDELVFPSNVSMGFGTFTIMDGHHWNWGACEMSYPLARIATGSDFYLSPYSFGFSGPQPAEFWAEEPSEEERIWGQGAGIQIDWLKVGYQQCGCQ